MTNIQEKLNEIAELLISEDVNAALKRVYELIELLKKPLGESVNESQERKECCSETCY